MVQSQPAPSVDMSPQWQKFIETKVNSFIKWDLIRFFHDNPHIQDTAESIASYVGRDTQTVIRELDGLVSNHVLMSNDHTHVKIYQMTDDLETRDLIRDFVAACFDRSFRVKAIHYVIHGTRQ
jgi:hypothetical protein